MAVYTTFFLCEPTTLVDGFPGWRVPLEEPVRREIRNPFTGELMVIQSREPEWPENNMDEVPDLNYQAITIEGSYEDYLEARLPPFVHRHPHWAAKELTPAELEPLLDILDVQGRLEPAIYSPPLSGNAIEEFPAEFLAKLKSIDARAAAERWAAALSTPEYTHSVSGVKLSGGWTAREAFDILKPIVSLGLKATPAQRMYLLTEV
jgi:hypothetical protein